MKRVFLLFVVVCFFTSCNITESIVFNEKMGGEYSSSFDMSPMMQIANSQGGSKKDASEMKKMDTTIVFNDLYKTHKDSIAALSDEQRAQLEKLKGMTVKVQMDEANGVFNFEMLRPFKSVSDLAHISDQMDDAMGVVKTLGSDEGQPQGGPMDELAQVDKVSYSFVNNTFSRFEPIEEVEELEEGETEEDLEETDENDFGKQLEAQFEEIFSTSYYTLVYKFPRKVKSVSSKDATISEDGKTVFLEVPWTVIQKDKSVLNINVVLED